MRLCLTCELFPQCSLRQHAPVAYLTTILIIRDTSVVYDYDLWFKWLDDRRRQYCVLSQVWCGDVGFVRVWCVVVVVLSYNASSINLATRLWENRTGVFPQIPLWCGRPWWWWFVIMKQQRVMCCDVLLFHCHGALFKLYQFSHNR